MKYLSLLLASTFAALPAFADTRNGNDFALYFSEATSNGERKELYDDAKGNPHYFRYLLIMELDDSDEYAIHIKALEPASLMNLDFVITKRVSRAKLKEEPESVVGKAIAVTGVIKSITKNTIIVSPVIVRHKDKLKPGRGKEMFYEIDPSGTFYSYTGGKRPVSLTIQDKDLLQHRDRILAEKGNEGWAEFLETEIAKRKKARAEAAKAKRLKDKAEREKKNAEQAQP